MVAVSVGVAIGDELVIALVLNSLFVFSLFFVSVLNPIPPFIRYRLVLSLQFLNFLSKMTSVLMAFQIYTRSETVFVQ